MSEAKKELVQTWLKKAQHDLAAARKLAAGSDPYRDTAIYLCQQAAEKALKGFLVFHDRRFTKTHNIGKLISLAAPFAADFSSWIEVGRTLTPYATIFRYPGEKFEPDRVEFDQALKNADELYQFILSLLPAEVHP